MTDRLHIPKGKYARTSYVSPIDAALEIIGGKYKVAILYYIRESVLRFREGSETAQALRWFQSVNKLPVSGQIDNPTVQALRIG
jgi:hypothetical protein